MNYATKVGVLTELHFESISGRQRVFNQESRKHWQFLGLWFLKGSQKSNETQHCENPEMVMHPSETEL